MSRYINIMIRKDIKELAENPNHISGIYNYCDYWCERCLFTSRCLNYQSRAKDCPECDDVNSHLFWDHLADNLETTLELAREKAEAYGITIADIKESAHAGSRKKTYIHDHELSVITRKYISSVEEWFKINDAVFAEKNNELLAVSALELPDRHPDIEAAELDECIDVIRWYQRQIHAKLVRALSYDNSSSINNVQNDGNGSAKVSLLAIDASVTAWTRLCKLIPEREDSIIDILLSLDNCRRKTEAIFPKSRAFVRPGFDE